MPFLQVGFYCSSSCPSPRAIGNRTGTSASQARLWNNSLGLQSPACEDAYSHWLHLFAFSPMCFFQLFPQIACQRGCIVTLVAFVWLFSTVCFQMFPQIVCTRGCILCSGGTLLWDNRRLIGRSLIVLARKVQNNRD